MFRPRLKSLSYYLDKALSPREAKSLEKDLEKSGKDRKCLEIMETMGTALEPQKGLSADFTKKFMQNLPDVKRIQEPSYGRIAAVSGFIMIYRSGQDEGIEAFPEMALKKGDELRVIGNSVALIELNDGSTIYLNKDTNAEFKNDPNHLFLNAGEMFSIMNPQKKPFLVSTPSAMLAVLGTQFSAKVTETFATILSVIKGSVMFRNDTGKVVVNKCEQVEATRSAKPVPRKVTDPYSLIGWTGPLTPKKERKGAIMKKLLYIIIVIVVAVVGFLGYRFYKENLVYEPMAKPKTVSEGAPGAVPSADQQATAAANQTSSQIMMGGDRFVFKKTQPLGTKILLRMENIQSTEVNAPNVQNPIRNKMNMTMDILSTVLNDTPDGGQETLIQFPHIKVEQRDAKGGFIYDSKNPQDRSVQNPVAGIMTALADTQLRVFTDAQGRLVKMDGFDGYLDSLNKISPGIKGQNQDSDSMKDMISSFTTDMMPDTPVKIGDTWPFETKISIPTVGTMNTSSQYTFKDWDKRGNVRCARIEFKGNIATTPDASAAQQTMNMSIKDGVVSGKMWFDEATGLLLENISEQIITMESKVKVPLPSGVREKTTTIKMTQNINVKLVESNLFQ